MLERKEVSISQPYEVLELGTYVVGQCARCGTMRCRAVLAHRRNYDAVSQRGTADGEWLEECRNCFDVCSRCWCAWRDDMLGCEVVEIFDPNIVIRGCHLEGVFLIFLVIDKCSVCVVKMEKCLE